MPKALFRRVAASWPLMVINPQPVREIPVAFSANTQPVVTPGAVKSLYVGILLRVAGWIYLSAILFCCAHCSSSLMYSGPLSQRIAAGLPCHSMTCSSTRLTREAGKEKSTSMQCFAIEVIDHIKQPHRTTIAELVMLDQQ